MTPFSVSCAVPVWMMELGDVPAPSIPIQVAEAPRYCVGTIVGTVQFPATWLNLGPPLVVAIWPAQLVDSSAFVVPGRWGCGGVTK